MVKRGPIAYGLILLIGVAISCGILVNLRMSLSQARLRFRDASVAETRSVGRGLQENFHIVADDLDTISRLPAVRRIDRHATNFSAEDQDTVQQIYDSLSRNVAVSEVYIVPRTINAELIDPVTGSPEAPILMFDNEITGSQAGAAVKRRFETEIYEYHLLAKQNAWLAEHAPTVASLKNGRRPILSGPLVVTCDNTVYNRTLDNADRTGIVMSLPFYAPDGRLAGTISAIIRGMLPPAGFALVNPGYGLLFPGLDMKIDAAERQFAAAAEADPHAIYSGVLDLSITDARAPWKLWSLQPDAAFYARADVRGAYALAIGAWAAVLLLLLVALGILWLAERNARMIAQACRNLDDLADGRPVAEEGAVGRPGPVGDLARAFRKFRASLEEKQRLEEDAVQGRHAVERERLAREAEKAEAMEEQRRVVQSLAGALVSLTQGDLSLRIDEDLHGEYAALKEEFNQAATRMEEVMQRVQAITHTVASGSQQISTAADDMARRTEQQAAQLEEAAAALTELNDAVKGASRQAASVAGLAREVEVEATASGRVVQDAVQAMAEIEASSRRIANILQLIEEIAFQTNLLALNAGVEAARAGDAGRGFAVVATEVRALAGRSAEAAHEIRDIISASEKQVGSGVRLVNETGETLARITQNIASLTERVQDIAEATRRQGATIGTVNETVGQMDKVTQQNAAMIEQTSAAGARLSEEAALLADLVDEFTFSDVVAAEESAGPFEARNGYRAMQEAAE